MRAMGLSSLLDDGTTPGGDGNTPGQTGGGAITQALNSAHSSRRNRDHQEVDQEAAHYENMDQNLIDDEIRVQNEKY